MRTKKNVITIIVTGYISLGAVFSQSLNQSLVLIRPYEPSVSDAQKITTLPSLRDSLVIKPTFDYTIESKRIDTRFDVTPITPAKLQPLPQMRLYHGYIKVGAGTLPNGLAEVAVNTLRNKEYSAGALFRLDRADGNVKLKNDEKVFAGYNDINAKLFGQKFFRNNSILYGDMGVSGQTTYNYGYDTDAVDDSGNKIIPYLSEGDIRKRYVFADAKVGIRSSHFKTENWNYDVQLGYEMANNKLESGYIHDVDPNVIDKNGFVKFTENAVNVKAQLDNNMFGGNVKFDYFNRSKAFGDSCNSYVFDFNPWFLLDNDSVRLKVGMRASAYSQGDGMKLRLFPKIEFQFTLLKDIFIPFIGMDGYLNTNSYRNLITENPFVTPGLLAPISETTLQIYAGLKGTITSKLSYYLRADYFLNSEKENLHEYVFVNDTVYSRVQNHFTIVTDKIDFFRFKGELYFNPLESVDLGVKANIYKYKPKHAWHRPNYTLDFIAKYVLRDNNNRSKIILNFDVMCIGERYAKVFFDPDKDYRTLKPVAAINLGAEYRYTKSFSFFLKLNNLTGAQYERWNYYPSRRFNAMVGFTYSL